MARDSLVDAFPPEKEWPLWVRFLVMAERKRAWAAGYLDGEGYFGLAGNAPDLTTDSVHPQSIHKLIHDYGGTYSTRQPANPNSRRVFRWRVSGERARDVCRDVLPLLVVKGLEAQAIVHAKRFAKTALGDRLKDEALANRRASYGPDGELL